MTYILFNCSKTPEELFHHAGNSHNPFERRLKERLQAVSNVIPRWLCRRDQMRPSVPFLVTIVESE